MAQSETELIKKAQAGDTGAFEQLVYMYDKNVLSLALKYVNDEDLAKDIYQDVFIRVYRGLKNFQFKSSFSTWLYRITANVCITYKSSSMKRQFVSINNHDEDEYESFEIPAEDHQSSPERVAAGNEINRNIRAALDSIPAKHKMVFMLKHFEGYKIREIAVMLECQEGTVKKYLFEAVHTLREKLKSFN